MAPVISPRRTVRSSALRYIQRRYFHEKNIEKYRKTLAFPHSLREFAPVFLPETVMSVAV